MLMPLYESYFCRRLFSRGGDVAKRHDLGGPGFNRLQLCEGIIEIDSLFELIRIGGLFEIEYALLELAAAFGTKFAASGFDPNAPHRLVRSGEEVGLAVERLIADEPQIRFVNGGRGIQSVTGGLGCHSRGSKFA